MNLKLKRLVRTVSSEQYALFDLDRTDSEHRVNEHRTSNQRAPNLTTDNPNRDNPNRDNPNRGNLASGEPMPMTIGKLDLHYTNEGAYGTFLLWDEALRQLRPSARRDFVRALLDEVTQPMGVPNEYVVEFFAPALDQYELIHNVSVEGEEEEQITSVASKN